MSTHERFDDCKVARVKDGDTVHFQCSGVEEKVKVRLRGINTVEKGEPGYSDATDALRKMIGERSAKLEFETPGKIERDRYCRPLAYLFVDGRNLNVEMVRGCWSYFDTSFGKSRFVDDFRKAETEADCSGEAKYPTLQASGFIGPCAEAFVRAVDGDTVHIKCRTKELYQVQLLRSDAPDYGDPCVKSSRLALREMLVGRKISFLPEKEGAEPGKDGSGKRWLAYLQDVESGKIINVEMVREGHAVWDTRYEKGRFAEEFAAARAECYANKRCRARVRCEQGESG